MPSTSLKNHRLSSGLGVKISAWARWAMSWMGSRFSATESASFLSSLGDLGFLLGLHLRDLLEELRADVRRGEPSVEVSQVHDRLHLLPGGARAAGRYAVDARRVAQREEQHPEEHQLDGLHIEDLGVHPFLANLFLQGEELRVQTSQKLGAR